MEFARYLSRRKYHFFALSITANAYSLYHLYTTLFSNINRKISHALRWSWGIVLQGKGSRLGLSRRASNYSAKDRDGRKQFDESRFTLLADVSVIVVDIVLLIVGSIFAGERRSLTFLCRGLSVQGLLTCSTLVCALSINVRRMSHRREHFYYYFMRREKRRRRNAVSSRTWYVFGSLRLSWLANKNGLESRD